MARLGLGRLEKIRARAKNRKTHFPGATGPETVKNKIITASGMVVCNFLTVYVLTDRTPTGGKLRNTRILGRWHLEKSRDRAENVKLQFPGARARNAEKRYHAVRGGCPRLSYILCFGWPDPRGKEIAKYEDFRPFWLRAALGT